jgi:hypothetical protein
MKSTEEIVNTRGARAYFFRHYIGLRPNGEILLDPLARNALYALAGLALITSTVEAGIWTALLYQYYLELIPTFAAVSAITTFVSVFVTVWFFDSSLATYDFSNKKEYFRFAFGNRLISLLLRPIEAIINFVRKVFLSKWGLGIVVRVLLVLIAATAAIVGSLFLVNKQVLAIESRAYNAQVLQSLNNRVRQSIDQQYQPDLQKFSRSVEELRQAYVGEAEGTKGTLRYGAGRVTAIKKSLYEDAARRHDALDAEYREKLRSTLQAIDAQYERGQLSALAEVYGVMFQDPDSPTTGFYSLISGLVSGKHVDKLTRAAAVHGVLVLFFVSLLIIKLFQPRSLYNYLNEDLQTAYRAYGEGRYDNFLPDEYKSNVTPSFTSLEFERVYDIVRGAQEEAVRDTQRNNQRSHLKSVIADLNKREQIIGSRVKSLVELKGKKLAELNAVRVEIRRTTECVAAAERRLKLYEEEKADIENMISDFPPKHVDQIRTAVKRKGPLLQRIGEQQEILGTHRASKYEQELREQQLTTEEREIEAQIAGENLALAHASAELSRKRDELEGLSKGV